MILSKITHFEGHFGLTNFLHVDILPLFSALDLANLSMWPSLPWLHHLPKVYNQNNTLENQTKQTKPKKKKNES
jgi:hypothetical protein